MNQFDSNEKEDHSNNTKTSPPVPHTPEPSIPGRSEKNNSVKDGGSNKCQYEKPNDLPYWIQAYSSIAIVFCTIVIAVITGIYTHFAAKQATQMEKAVNVASDTEIRGLRAYIHVDKITITNIADPLPSEIRKTYKYKPTGAAISNPMVGPHIEIEIKNSGQTPAYKLEGWVDSKVLEYPRKSLTVYKPPQPQVISIIGRDAVRLLNKNIIKPLTKGEISALRNNSKAIYVYGEFTYTDIFQKKVHHNRFVYYHNGTVGPIGICVAAAVQEEGAD
jgi:hypothetical protein